MNRSVDWRAATPGEALLCGCYIIQLFKLSLLLFKLFESGERASRGQIGCEREENHFFQKNRLLGCIMLTEMAIFDA